MNQNPTTLISVLVVAMFAGCATDEDFTTRSSSLEKGETETITFRSWDEVQATQKTDYAVFTTATDAVVSTGVPCVEKDKEGRCIAIDPDSDVARSNGFFEWTCTWHHDWVDLGSAGRRDWIWVECCFAIGPIEVCSSGERIFAEGNAP